MVRFRSFATICCTLSVLPQSLMRPLLRGQHPRAQKFWAGSTIHRSFESFETVYLCPSVWPVAPRLCDCVPHRIDVSTQRVGEPLHCVESGVLRILQPSFEFAYVLVGHNSAKPHGEPAHRSECRPFPVQPFDPCHLSACQQSAWLDARRPSARSFGPSPDRRAGPRAWAAQAVPPCASDFAIAPASAGAARQAAGVAARSDS